MSREFQKVFEHIPPESTQSIVNPFVSREFQKVFEHIPRMMSSMRTPCSG